MRPTISSTIILEMLLKAVLLCHLLLTPLVFSFNIPSQFKDYGTEIEARQFSDEPLINYGIWGFIAGLSDYFIRYKSLVNNGNLFIV